MQLLSQGFLYLLPLFANETLVFHQNSTQRDIGFFVKGNAPQFGVLRRQTLLHSLLCCISDDISKAKPTRKDKKDRALVEICVHHDIKCIRRYVLIIIVLPDFQPRLEHIIISRSH